MKEEFPGYYRPSQEEFTLLWDKAILVLDANVLLNLYRYSASTREALLETLGKLKARLWIPHQVALEFQRRRLDVIADQIDAYKKITSTLEKFEGEITGQLSQFSRHSELQVDEMSQGIARLLKKYRQQVTKSSSKHPIHLEDEDPIRRRVDELLEGRLGKPYSAEELDAIAKEGSRRYERSIPPGIRDADKKNGNEYGDLIIWKQILDYSKHEKMPIILVTDDVKDDWWYRLRGLTIGPRPELVKEMIDVADVDFYMYQTASFMEYANRFLSQTVEATAIEEVREVQEEDRSKQLRSAEDWRNLLVEEISNSERIPVSPVQPPLYEAGDHVRHARFGEGIVLSCIASNNDHVVTVAFKGGGGIKKLMLSFAPLEKIA